MSDDKDKTGQDPEAEQAAPRSAGGLATGGEAAALEMESDAQTMGITQPAAAPRRGSSAVAWLALLLVLVLAAGAGWSVMELQRREASLLDRLTDLEVIATRKEANLEEFGQDLGRKWSRELEDSLDRMRQSFDGLERALQEQREATSRQENSLREAESQLAEQRAEMARFGANDRESWLLAEAEYLLRLANQRLIMAGDTVAAQALLSSADEILRDLDDVSMHEVRGAIASDLAAVRAVPRVDIEGVYLRLAALIEQAGQLVIFQLPESEDQPRDSISEDWQARLQRGYEDALLKLSNYIIIRRRDVPMQALMDPQWESLVRQNLRMLLEQAQVALLSGNPTLYRESLERAQHWVAEFFESDEAAARALAREITQLQGADVVSSMPDISGSLQALDDAMERRLQHGGGV